MAIRHLKQKYLIKEQFLEKNELITSDFSFSRISDFLLLWWGFLLFGFIQISQMHDGNIIILFPFLYFFFFSRNPNCKGTLTWYVATKWTVLTGFFGSEMVYVMFLSKDRVLIKFGLSWNFLAQSGSCCPSEGKSMSQIGLTWGNGKFGFWVMCPWISIRNEKGNLV